jgi:hypothetical protein
MGMELATSSICKLHSGGKKSELRVGPAVTRMVGSYEASMLARQASSYVNIGSSIASRSQRADEENAKD